MHPYGSPNHCVLHVDADSFFCQVEVLRNPALAGIPIAIQQHQDVIAVNYPAKQAGVKKHMLPTQARAILSAAGGRLVHVFTEPDGRVSYRPYREASAALMRLLASGLPAPACLAVQVVEKASIDEAYMQLALPTGAEQEEPLTVTLSDMPSWVAQSTALTWDYSHPTSVAETVRSTVKQQLGLTVSVGVAPNKLVAKLASRAAKPDGVHVVGSVAAVQQLLAATPVDRLPGFGGSVAAALSMLGLTHIAQLQAHSQSALAALLGGHQQSRLAAKLVQCAWGRHDAPVVNKGPPKSIQVQMTLTPQARPLPPNLVAAGRGSVAPAAAAAAGNGMLMPLLTGAADTMSRLAAVLGAMTGDLLGRVLLDRHSEDRWPGKLSATLTTSGQPPRTATRSTSFPTPALLTSAASTRSCTAAAQHVEPAAAAAAGGTAAAAAAAAAFTAPGVVSEKSFVVGSALHDAVVTAAVNLAQALVAPLPPHHPVTILNLSVSNFAAFETAAASGNIRRFATAAAAKASAVTESAAAAAAAAEVAAATAADAPPTQAGASCIPETAAAAPVQFGQQQHSAPAAAPPAPASIVQRPAKRKWHLDNAAAAAVSSGEAAAADRPAHPVPPVRDLKSVSEPPVLLSDMLLYLASSSTAVDVAEVQLDRLLGAACKARLLQL